MAVYAWPYPIFLETLSDIERMIEIRNFRQKNPEGEIPPEHDEAGHFSDPELDRIASMSDEEMQEELAKDW